jgi:hypothetical protein
MLVSVASFVPILIVGPISDTVGTTAVIFVMAIGVLVTGIVSVATRGPLAETDARPAADPNVPDPISAALGADRMTWHGPDGMPAPTPAVTPTPTVPPAQLDDAGATPVGSRGSGPSDPTDRD